MLLDFIAVFPRTEVNDAAGEHVDGGRNARRPHTTVPGNLEALRRKVPVQAKQYANMEEGSREAVQFGTNHEMYNN